MRRSSDILPVETEMQAARFKQILPSSYDELKSIAAMRMHHSRRDHTLQPTALVHELFLRMETYYPNVSFDNPQMFYAAAAEAMRQILIAHETAHRAQKRNNGRKPESLQGDPVDELGEMEINGYDLLSLNEALAKLEARDPKKAELVKLRFFAERTMPEAARLMGISLATAERWWAYAKVLLAEEMGL